MSAFFNRLHRQQEFLLFSLAVVMVIAIGILDSFTGPELSLSAFYLLPIFVATSSIGIGAGLLISVASIVCYLLADRILSISYTHSAVPYWNSGVRLVFFVVVAYILGKRKEAEDRLQHSEERFRLLVEGVRDYALLMLDKNGRIANWNEGAQRLFGYEPEEIVGKNFSVFYTSEDLDSGKPEIDLKIANVKEKLTDEGWRVRKDRSSFFADGILTPLRGKDLELRGYSLLLRDMTERRNSAEAQRVLAELHEIDRAILNAETSEKVARESLTRLKGMFPFLSGRVIMIDFDRGLCSVLAAEGEQSGRAMDLTALEATEIPGLEVMKEGTPYFPNGSRNAVDIPLLSQGQTIGILELEISASDSLSDLQLEIAREVADQLAVAIHNTQLFESLKQAHHRLQLLSKKLIEVQEAEKRHIARELHDEMGQALTAVKIHLQEVEIQSGDDKAQLLLRETIHIVQGLLEQIRSLSLDLRPPVLDDLGLIPALRWYVSRQAKLAGFSVNFSENIGDRQLPPEVETTCFRVAQEALTNVVRHAAAQHVSVTLTGDDEKIHLLIKDDGCGFDVPAIREETSNGTALGLLGMRERALLVRGAVEVESAPKCGTEVRAEFPIGAYGAGA